MDRRIKFRHLEVFTSIARSQSLKRAAENLNLTQPAVSKTLKDLEVILGVALLERGRGGVRLTPEGEVFLSHAEQSMAALQSGLNNIASLGQGGAAQISVGALPSVAAHLLPKAVLAFRRQAPDTVLRVLEGPHDHLTDQLRSGTLDLVVGRLGAADTMVGLSFTQLYTEDVVLVVAPGNPLAGITRLDQIQGFPVLYPPGSAAIRPLVARMMMAKGLALFGNRIEAASSAFGRAMTLGPAQAVWVISKGVVAADLASGALVPLNIDTSDTAGPVGVMARSEEAPSAVALLFRQSLFGAVDAEG